MAKLTKAERIAFELKVLQKVYLKDIKREYKEARIIYLADGWPIIQLGHYGKGGRMLYYDRSTDLFRPLLDISHKDMSGLP